MKIEEVIDALRPFADEHYPNCIDLDTATLRASTLVWEYDHMPRSPADASLSDTNPSIITIGLKGDAIVFSSEGTDDVEASFFVFDPDGARAIAQKLIELAKQVDARARKGH